MADLNPTIEAVTGKEAALRESFKTKFAGNISSGAYDQRDIDRLDKDDGYARCFLRTLLSKGDPAKGADVVDLAFKYRKEIGIWDMTDQTFPQEIWERNGIYYKGQTLDGYKLLYVRSASNTAKGKEEMDLMRRFIAYNLEKHHKENPEQFCVVMFDMHGSSVSNMNTDITKFFITCFSTYFPAYLAYMINYDLPTLLSAAWSVISAFMNKEQKGKIMMSTKKDIGKYLSDDVRSNWPHMAK